MLSLRTQRLPVEQGGISRGMVLFEGQGESEEDITEHMKTLYQNVLVLDSGARGSTTTFIENGQGDVLIAWENEAFLSMQEEPGEYEIVVPSASVLCQPTVAVVDEVVDRKRQPGCCGGIFELPVFR